MEGILIVRFAIMEMEVMQHGLKFRSMETDPNLACRRNGPYEFGTSGLCQYIGKGGVLPPSALFYYILKYDYR